MRKNASAVIEFAVAFGFFQYPFVTFGPLTQISPRSPSFTSRLGLATSMNFISMRGWERRMNLLFPGRPRRERAARRGFGHAPAFGQSAAGDGSRNRSCTATGRGAPPDPQDRARKNRSSRSRQVKDRDMHRWDSP